MSFAIAEKSGSTLSHCDKMGTGPSYAIRPGCKDIWNAFMVDGASFCRHDIPFCPTTAARISLNHSRQVPLTACGHMGIGLDARGSPSSTMSVGARRKPLITVSKGYRRMELSSQVGSPQRQSSIIPCGRESIKFTKKGKVR